MTTRPQHFADNQRKIREEAVANNDTMEETILRFLDKMTGVNNIDQRWLAIGRTHLEQGFMAINRAIMQPGRLLLPGDQGFPSDEEAIIKDHPQSQPVDKPPGLSESEKKALGRKSLHDDQPLTEKATSQAEALAKRAEDIDTADAIATEPVFDHTGKHIGRKIEHNSPFEPKID